MFRIVLLREGLIDREELHLADLIALRFDPADHLAYQPATYTIGLDHDEGLLIVGNASSLRSQFLKVCSGFTNQVVRARDAYQIARLRQTDRAVQCRSDV